MSLAFDPRIAEVRHQTRRLGGRQMSEVERYIFDYITRLTEISEVIEYIEIFRHDPAREIAHNPPGYEYLNPDPPKFELNDIF